jgi:hypothetical protein
MTPSAVTYSAATILLIDNLQGALVGPASRIAARRRRVLNESRPRSGVGHTRTAVHVRCGRLPYRGCRATDEASDDLGLGPLQRDFGVIEHHEPTPNITVDQRFRAYPQAALRVRIKLGNRFIFSRARAVVRTLQKSRLLPDLLPDGPQCGGPSQPLTATA